MLCSIQCIQARGADLKPLDIEDNTIFFPSEQVITKFMAEEGFDFSPVTEQGGTDEDLQPIVALSIDGGGMKGMMPAIWLHKLHCICQKELKEFGYKSLADVFDYTIGTSIGGILAAGVAADIAIEELSGLMEKYGPQIFSTGWKVKLNNLGGLVGSQYDPENLEKILQATFKNMTLQDIKNKKKTQVILTSCTTEGEPRLFKSLASSDQDYRLWEIGRCTSAAPTYFPAYSLKISPKDKTYIPKMRTISTTNETKIYFPEENPKTKDFVDGGMWINNPSPIMLGNIVTNDHQGQFVPKKIILLSLGTGESSFKPLEQNSGTNPSTAIASINILMSSNNRGNHQLMSMCLGESYFRVNTVIGNIDLADTKKETIEELKYAASDKKCEETLRAFVQKIKEVKFAIKKK
jgi:predicted acylesterase/phospholipase RssA